MTWGRRAALERERLEAEHLAGLMRDKQRLASEVEHLKTYAHQLEASLVACGEVATQVLEHTKDWADDDGTRYVRQSMVELALRTGFEP